MGVTLSLAGVVLGALLIVGTTFDVVWTAFGNRAGPVSRRLMSLCWRAALKAHHAGGHDHHHRLLGWVGLGAVLLNMVLWVVATWAGWTLVFLGAEDAVVSSRTGAAADLWERIYFTGYVISSLGLGDFVPHRQPWEVLTAVASLNGLALVTFSVTYLVPVIQASVQKRSLAVHISALGATPQDVLLSSWDGRGCGALGDQLTSLAGSLAHVEQQYLAYPALHYMHAASDDQAIAVRLAILDEALTILDEGVERPIDPPPQVRRAIRQINSALLQTVRSPEAQPADEPPPPPSLRRLREAGIPCVPDDVFARRIAGLEERRRKLVGLLHGDGWTWDSVCRADKGEEHAEERPETAVEREEEQ